MSGTEKLNTFTHIHKRLFQSSNPHTGLFTFPILSPSNFPYFSFSYYDHLNCITSIPLWIIIIIIVIFHPNTDIIYITNIIIGI